jgi:hypothetical protein
MSNKDKSKQQHQPVVKPKLPSGFDYEDDWDDDAEYRQPKHKVRKFKERKAQ